MKQINVNSNFLNKDESYLDEKTIFEVYHS